MDKSLIDIVKDEMAVRKSNPRRLAAETGIPADRIYKWIQRGLQPKTEDADKLRLWLKGGQKLVEVPHETTVAQEGDIDYQKTPNMGVISDLSSSNKILALSHQELAEANKILAKNTEELIALLKISLKTRSTSSGEQLDGPQLPFADHGPAKGEQLRPPGSSGLGSQSQTTGKRNRKDS